MVAMAASYSLLRSNEALNWFESYLTNRMQSTRLGTSLSIELTVTYGVPQGSILGPLMFSLYMNDLPSVVKFSSVESYVDDTKVYLRLIASWCCRNKLLINPDKTKLILFGTKQLLSKVLDIRVSFLGQQLISVSSVKDLGIILDLNLTFNEHVDTLTSSLISILCQISRVRHLFSKSVLTTILNCLVFCKLFYCSTVWSGKFAYNINKLQLVQNFAARVLTNTKKFDHISPVLRALHWPSIKNQLLVRDATMLYKIVNSLAPPYLECYVIFPYILLPYLFCCTAAGPS